ncbi:MAG: TetR/AcrR family transcriptional regulator, partial [Erysipelotrichaceae bacterium]
MTKDIKKRAIEEVAVNLFLEKGYNNTTINDICEAMDITKPTFYKYVNAKEELMLDLYDVAIKRICRDTLSLLEADTDIERIMVLFYKLVDFTVTFGSDLFSQMFIANLNHNYRSFSNYKEMDELCMLLIKKAQIKGEIHNMEDPYLINEAILYTYIGYEIAWCVKD